MIDLFCGKTPQNDRKQPQSIPANEPYVEGKDRYVQPKDHRIIAAKRAHQQQKLKEGINQVASAMIRMLLAFLRLVFRWETLVITLALTVIFGLSYALWQLALWVQDNRQTIAIVSGSAFIFFLLSVMIRMTITDIRQRVPFDTEPTNGQTEPDKTDITIVNNIDTNRQSTIKIINNIK